MENVEQSFHILTKLLLGYAAKGIVLAYSGGMDSALLLHYLKKLPQAAGRFTPVFVRTPLDVGVDDVSAAVMLDVDTLSIPEVADNLPDRCYHCKRAMFGALRAYAQACGFGVVMDGTNADDKGKHRPGLRAIQELGVVSPLAEAGLTKAEIRRLVRAEGLAFSNRPSVTCLATRFYYGEKLDHVWLKRVKGAEAFIRAMLARDVAVRVRVEEGGLARIEVSPAAISTLGKNHSVILAELRKIGFESIVIDPLGYRPRD